MSNKNLAQLEEEALELGLDVSELKTKKEFQAAIKAKKEELNDEENEDEEADDEEDEEEEEEEVESGEVSFETTERVEFSINGVKYEGTQFSFPEDVVEDRKEMLKAAYGAGIIK